MEINKSTPQKNFNAGAITATPRRQLLVQKHVMRPIDC